MKQDRMKQLQALIQEPSAEGKTYMEYLKGEKDKKDRIKIPKIGSKMK